MDFRMFEAIERFSKMMFITNLCLIALIAVIVISFQIFVAYETTDVETTTITVEDYEGGDANASDVQEPIDGRGAGQAVKFCVA